RADVHPPVPCGVSGAVALRDGAFLVGHFQHVYLFCAFRGWRGRWGCWGAPFTGGCFAGSATGGDTSSLLAYGDVFASYCCYYSAWSKLHRVGVAASSASRCRECRSPHRCGGQPARPGGVSRRVEG